MRNTLTVHINAPVERVFDFCADFETTTPVLAPGTKITEVSPGPAGVGTVIRYVNDRFGLVGRTEVVQYARPHTLMVVTAANGFGPFTTTTVVEGTAGGGSAVRIYSNAKPFTPTRWMRPFAWMFAPLLRKPEAQGNARWVELARKTLEARPPADGGWSTNLERER